MTLPLAKVRILDFSHLLPGELCSTILADLGAEITRIEPVKPGLAHKMPPLVKGESLYYWSVHRNKKRLRLDLKSEPAKEIVQALAGRSDVVLENFRPGVMSRLGLGYRHLKRINQRIIYCSISGYGQNTAWAQRPGHDLNFVAEAGILNLNRLPDGPPVIPGALISDYLAAVYAALAVTSALNERHRTGKGRHLDISMFECALSTMNILSTAMLYTGLAPESGYSMHQSDLPNYNIYECADKRFLVVAALEPQFWQRFCQLIAKPDWIETYSGGPERRLVAEIAGIIRKKPLSHWLAVFEGSDCCVSPVHNLREALDCLPTRERAVLTHLAHPLLGNIPQLATPLKSRDNHHSAQKSGARDLATPLVDAAADAASILKPLGYSKRQIDKLKDKNVISLS